jgi:fructose-1,6-bisphosphatase
MNAFNQLGQPSILSHSLRQDSAREKARLKKELAYMKQNGKVGFGLNPALLFSGRIPTMPNGEYRK